MVATQLCGKAIEDAKNAAAAAAAAAVVQEENKEKEKKWFHEHEIRFRY